MNESGSPSRKAPATSRPSARRAPRETATVRPDDDQIRARAYEIYLRRNGHPGDPVNDWFCAERELIEETPARAAPSGRKRKARS